MSVLPLGECACEPAWSVRNSDPLVKDFSSAAYIRGLTISASRPLGARKAIRQLGLAAATPGIDSTGVTALE
jgi:hypothetical protein